jgi:uncharacterized protein YrzB (UPF0473 family)
MLLRKGWGRGMVKGLKDIGFSGRDIWLTAKYSKGFQIYLVRNSHLINWTQNTLEITMSKNEQEPKNISCECNDEECECDTITLELEDGSKQEFMILDTMEHKKKHYIALAPLEGDEYFIYGFREEGENVEFFSIEDEKEFDSVAKAFEKRFAEEDEAGE